jgi:hypothetical protein
MSAIAWVILILVGEVAAQFMWTFLILHSDAVPLSQLKFAIVFPFTWLAFASIISNITQKSYTWSLGITLLKNFMVGLIFTPLTIAYAISLKAPVLYNTEMFSTMLWVIETSSFPMGLWCLLVLKQKLDEIEV